MTNETRAYHGAHEDERSRVNALKRHEYKIREERARVKRNLQSVLTVVEPQPCDFPGCVE
jgi:hypothetical protein